MQRFLAAAEVTPVERDRFIDALRAFAVVVVVAGHWFMAVPHFSDGNFTATNALGSVEGLWAITWLFQVMPLFFFVGGFASVTALDSLTKKKLGYANFLAARFQRLLTPVMVLLGTWTVVAILLAVAGVSTETIGTVTTWVTQPLWFVAAYLAVIALAPVTLRWHRRNPVVTLTALVSAAIFVDAIRFGLGVEPAGAFNFIVVWVIAHQLGYFYADGSLLNLTRRAHVTIAGSGLVALITLVNAFGYPGSMVGQAGDKFSNMSPPTVAIVALALFQVGVVLVVRPGLVKPLRSKTVWGAVIATNTFAMTLYLWHLTALVLAVVVLYPLGIPQFEAGSPLWFLSRPIWFALVGIPLFALLITFVRFDQAKAPIAIGETGRHRSIIAAATATAALAILALALTNLGGVGTFDHGRQLGPLYLTPTAALTVLVAAFLSVEQVVARQASEAKEGRVQSADLPSTEQPSALP